jgi:uncharacterized protein (DUF2141 family)
MISVIFSLFSVFFMKEAPASKLTIEITNVRNANGKLWIAMFRPGDALWAEKPNIYKIITVTSKISQIAEFDLEPGRYALAVYHDLNDNNVLDKNFIGIPKEPYGFGNDFRPRFSAPSFDDCAFDLPAGGRKIFVKLTN